MSKNSVVFFGTGSVAARSLELALDHLQIEAVITKPKPAHHKEAFPVTDLAQERGLKIYEVSTKAELDELMRTQKFTSPAGLVIDFGIIFSQEVLDYFPLDIINSHFSLLPQWRGADPITFSLLSEDPNTGVSIMLVTEKMDEGPIIAQLPYVIPQTNNQTLTQDLIELSDQALRVCLPKYFSGELKVINQDKIAEQNGKSVSFSRKLTKEDGQIDLSKPATQLEREVRAYLGWPGSRLTLNLNNDSKLEVTVTEASISDQKQEDNPLSLQTSNGYFNILKLKLPGKTEMTTPDFINGYSSRLAA
jgi:methionyl-tRNA formyltransferase